jgi:hypothetical protein
LARVARRGHGSGKDPDLIGPPCSHCLQAHSTNHITQIKNGTKITLSLCDPCAEKWHEQEGLADLLPAKLVCTYCGATPSCAATNTPSEQAARGTKLHYACLPCQQVFYRLYLPMMSGTLPLNKQAAPSDDPVEVIKEIDSQVRLIARNRHN